jgi:hypothetical protein
MKSSNKRKLEEIKRKFLKTAYSSHLIIYDPKGPLPELSGKGPYILLPDNGHRLLDQQLDEKKGLPNRWLLRKVHCSS